MYIDSVLTSDDCDFGRYEQVNAKSMHLVAATGCTPSTKAIAVEEPDNAANDDEICEP